MPATQELRVFISSAFCDLAPEREHLAKEIFPTVRARCRERGVAFTEVDLRSDTTAPEVRACLEEIDRTRPYFIGITGDQYGDVPQTSEIDAELTGQFPWVEQA